MPEARFQRTFDEKDDEEDMPSWWTCNWGCRRKSIRTEKRRILIRQIINRGQRCKCAQKPISHINIPRPSSGLVIPDDHTLASAPKVAIMRKMFNEDMATEHIQTAELKLQRVLPATLTSVVISYCSHSLEWLPAYLRGMQINDLTIYSKCNHTSKLTQSPYINEIHKIAHETVKIKTLQNVGGCDHTYAHDMAHRDWA